MFLPPSGICVTGGVDMAFAERLGNFIWNPWLLGLFLLSGL